MSLVNTKSFIEYRGIRHRNSLKTWPSFARARSEMTATMKGWRCDETAADLFGRLAHAPLRLPCLPTGLHAGEAFELFGEPGTGKTALLMECALQCIMPASFEGVAVGGHGEGAVLLDTDGDFDPVWLEAALQARFLAAATRGGESPLALPAAKHAALRFSNECLDRLHVLQCADRHQMLCSLFALPRLVGMGATTSAVGESSQGRGEIRLLLIDSPSAFQWVERAGTRHQPRSGAPPPARQQKGASSAGASQQAYGLAPAPSLAAVDTFDEQVSLLLRRMLVEEQVCAVWSRCPTTSHGAGWQFPMQNGTPPSWSALATHRLDLKRAGRAPVPAPPQSSMQVEARFAARLVSFGATPHLRVAAEQKAHRFDVTLTERGALWLDAAAAC